MLLGSGLACAIWRETSGLTREEEGLSLRHGLPGAGRLRLPAADPPGAGSIAHQDCSPDVDSSCLGIITAAWGFSLGLGLGFLAG